MTIHSRVYQIRLKKKFHLMFSLKHLLYDLSHCISASICSENRNWWLPLVLNQFSSVMSDSLQTHGLQHARPPCPSPTSRVYPNSCPLSQWCHPTILSSVVPSPTFNLSQHQGLFKWVSSLHQVAKVLEFQLQHQSFQWIFRTDFPVFRDCEKHSGRWGNGHFRIGPLLSVSLELVKS